MKEEKLTEQRDGQNVIALRQDGKRRWAIASAGMGEKSTRFLYGEYADKLAEYEEIGTPEECRAAVEKQVVKKPIRNDKCTCPSCGTYNEVIKKRRNTVAHDVVYCWHCGQAVEIMRSDEERD